MKATPNQLDITGVNWSIKRGLVATSLAEAAGQEILEAIATENDMIAFDHEQLKYKYKGYVISGWDSVDEPTAKDSDFSFYSLHSVRAALEPFKDPELLADPDAYHFDQGFVNILEPGGKVPLHTDNEPWSLIFISLLGVVTARIKHRDEASYTVEQLHPGDALKIVNPKAIRQRPRHDLINTGNIPRVSYGEYTSQHG